MLVDVSPRRTTMKNTFIKRWHTTLWIAIFAIGLVGWLLVQKTPHVLQSSVINTQVNGQNLRQLHELPLDAPWELLAGMRSIVYCQNNTLPPATSWGAPLGYRWATPQDFPGMRVYEYSPNRAHEKVRGNQVWDGEWYNFPGHTNTLTSFKAGRTYYIETSQTLSFSCAVPIQGSISSSSSSQSSSAFGVSSSSSSFSTSTSSSYASSTSSSSWSSSSASTASSSSASSTSSSTIDLSKGIYFTKPDGIYRANADGTMVQKLFTTAQEVNGLGVNAKQNRIYYSVDTNIYSSNIQGGDVQILLNRSSAPNAYPVEKIFLDEQRDYLYWQDHSGFYRINIGSTPANGESIKSCDVIQYLGSRCEYALDVTRQLVYTLSVLRYTGVNTLSLTSYDMQTHIESSSLIDQRFTPSNELGIAGIAMEWWPDYGIQFGVQRNTLDGYGNVLNTSTEFFAIFPDFSLTSLNSFGLFPSDTSKLSMKAQWLAIGEDGRAIYKNGNNWGSAPFLNGANNIVLKEVINVPFVNSCGNSIVEGDEECDFGPNNELYGCFANCSNMIPPDELP